MEIVDFIKKNYSTKSYGKYLLYLEFGNYFKNLEMKKELSVGLLGGSSNQPEIEILDFLGFKLKITTLGIENDDDYFLDLNEINENIDYEFDLVVCTQVLEHIWNHESFFKNVSKVTKNGGLLYLDCPKSNKTHMEPSFYSSGFTSKYLTKNLEINDFVILKEGEVGSEVLYKSIHMTQSWYSVSDIQNRYRFNSKNLFYKFRHLMKLSNLGQYLVLKRNLDRNSSNFKTMSYVFAKKEA